MISFQIGGVQASYEFDTSPKLGTTRGGAKHGDVAGVWGQRHDRASPPCLTGLDQVRLALTRSG
jgi:hypothetical protein